MATVSGRVTYRGKSVDDAVVASGAHTDRDGRYVLTTQPGEIQLYAESPIAHAFSRGPTVTIAKGEHRTGVDIELDLAASVSGVVIDQNGLPVKSATVRLSKLRDGDFGVGTTADDGTFTVGGLAGGGDYIYEVSGAEGPYPPATGKRFPSLAIRDGTTALTGVRIIVRLGDLDIAGRVIDTDNKPVADLEVFARRKATWAKTSTDATGAFQLRGLAPGTYDLSTTALGGSEYPSVAAGQHDVVIHASKPANIEGTLEGFGRVREVTVNGDIANIDGASFQAHDIAAGKYTIEASDDVRHGSTIVTVTAGATVKVTVRALGLGDAVGTIVDDATGTPAAGIACTAGNSRTEVKADGLGSVRFDHLAAEPTRITCSDEHRSATIPIAIVENQQAHFEMRVGTRSVKAVTHVGMALEDQFSDIVVQSIEPDGIAARAGLLVGDIVVTVDGQPPYDGYTTLRQIQQRPVGSIVHLAIERGDDTLAIDLPIN